MSKANAQLLEPISTPAMPRLGFIGTGWIGRMRMEALLKAKLATFSAVHDPSPAAARAAAEMAPGTQVNAAITSMMKADVDGLVIATPSALHAEHCIEAINNGKAVFCQKPLARNREETQRVVDAARAANKFLGVDFSYRYLAGVDQLQRMIASGELGTIFAADLVFHNAYGPDKPWFYDVNLSGGGCVIDLGIHLVDLALWILGKGEISKVSSSLFRNGKRLHPPHQVVEDYATASFTLNETQLQLSCSWNLHAGRDAVIEATFYGSQGGASIRNVNGSFYDFEVYRFQGTSQQKLAGYPDAWGGRALIEWVKRLASSDRFDPKVEQVVQVADVIDRIYGR